MKTIFIIIFSSILISNSIYAQRVPEKEILFQVQDAQSTDTISFKYENSGTPYLFNQNDCIYESKSSFNFTHTIIDDYTDADYYAHIVFDDDYPLTTSEMIHCLLKITVSKNGTEMTTFYYDTRDCQYYTQCDFNSQDITLRYDVDNDYLFFKDSYTTGGTASLQNGWEEVSGSTKTFWGVKGISHCPLDFAGAPATPSNFAVTGSVGQPPQLDWDDNDEPDLVGYYLYRNYNGSGFSLFDSVSTPTNTYTDNTYEISNSKFDPTVCYKLTAYDEEGLESSQTSQRCKNVEAEKGLVIQEKDELTIKYNLGDAYPNPFNPSTTISFQIPESGHVYLTINDVTGKLVKTLINDVIPAGNFNVILDASDLSSGVYYYTLKTNDFISTKKLILIK